MEGMRKLKQQVGQEMDQAEKDMAPILVRASFCERAFQASFDAVFVLCMLCLLCRLPPSPSSLPPRPVTSPRKLTQDI
jgi:hypothetical protein